MASLYKRKGSEKWWIKIHRAGTAQGKNDRVPTGTADRATAQAMLDVMRGDRARGIPVNPKAHTILFAQLCTLVQDDYENNEYATAKHTLGRFTNHIAPFFGAMLATSIGIGDIADYRTKRRKEGAKPATVKHELELVRRAFKLGWDRYRIPPLKFELPDVHNARQGFFDQPDFERVLALIDDQDYRDFLLFAYMTEWRTGEIKDLRRRHLDFTMSCVRLDPGTTKNGDARVFPMINGLDAMLRRRVQAPGFANDHVFTYQQRKKDGTAIGARRPIGDFQKALNTACYKAGIPCKTETWSYVEPKSGKTFTGVRVLSCSRVLHDLRRTAVNNLTNMGTPDKVSMDLCGHRTREVFDRYKIVSKADLDVARERMNAAYSGLLENAAVGTVVGPVQEERKIKSFVAKR